MESSDCIQFVTTRRGKTAVLYRGYRYYNVRALGHKVYWRCCTRSCCATLVTADGRLTKIGDDHNHPGDASIPKPTTQTLRLVKLETTHHAMSGSTTGCAYRSVESFKLRTGCLVQAESVLERKSRHMQISSISASRFRRDVALKVGNKQDVQSVKTKGCGFSSCLQNAQGQSVTCLKSVSSPKCMRVEPSGTVGGVIPTQNASCTVRYGSPPNPGIPPNVSRLATPASTLTSAPPVKRARLELGTGRSVSNGKGQHQAARQSSGTFTHLAGQHAPISTLGLPQTGPHTVWSPGSRQLHAPIHKHTSTPQPGKKENESIERIFFNPDHSSHIMTELSALWKSGKFVDAAILVGEMKLQAHRMVLFAASPYLRASFDHLDPSTELRVKMPSDIKLDIVFQFLTYIYDGMLKLNATNVQPLLKISLMLRMEHLSACCREFVAQAARSGVMSGVQAEAVHTPLLVLVDQRAQDTGHSRVDMCTQTLSPDEECGSRRPVPSQVDFERVFGEDTEESAVQSDMDLYQEYETSTNAEAGRTGYTSHDAEETVTPMVLIKNEFIDPEYDLSMNNIKSTAPECGKESMSSPCTSGPKSKQDSYVVPPVAVGGSTLFLGTMQVVPGLDMDDSSHSSTELEENCFNEGAGRGRRRGGVVTDGDDEGGGGEFLAKGEVAIVPHRHSTQTAPDDTDCPNARHHTLGTHSAHNESGNSETPSLCLRSSEVRRSHSAEASVDEATPQFGTEEFLPTDFDVHPTKIEPKDPS